MSALFLYPTRKLHIKTNMILSALIGLAILLSPVVAVSSTDENSMAEESLTQTASNPQISYDQLKLILTPLTKDELLIEARLWQKLVKSKAMEIAEKEISIRDRNREIEGTKYVKSKAVEIQEELTVTSEMLSELAQSVDALPDDATDFSKLRYKAESTYEHMSEVIAKLKKEKEKLAAAELPDAGQETRENIEKALRSAENAHERIDVLKGRFQQLTDGGEGIPGDFIRDVAEIITLAQQVTKELQEQITVVLAGLFDEIDTSNELDQATELLEEVKDNRKGGKVEELVEITELREERTLLIDNLRAVINELQSKTDSSDTETIAEITDYRLYISGVSGISLDVTDTMSTWVSLKEWAISEEGGQRWLKNIGIFVFILIAAWYFARFLSFLALKAMKKAKMPALLSDFLTKTISFIVLAMGFIWALSALEISVAPLLAIVGATGFILAFAMQDSLSNFAAGMMIMIFRPFDIGDSIEAGGVSGTVNSASLVSTSIRTFDNKMMMVPNSKIWSDVIVNITGVRERRVDMEFRIGYEDNYEHAEDILREIVDNHPKVVKHRESVIKMHTFADSAVIFICRPWTAPGDYWSVYWDITREVKRRFDAEGIGIPYPQQDVHLHFAKASEIETLSRLNG